MRSGESSRSGSARAQVVEGLHDRGERQVRPASREIVTATLEGTRSLRAP